MVKVDETDRLRMRKCVRYSAILSTFLIAYEDILEKQLLDKQNEGNFKGLYQKARWLWIKAHEMKISQNHSVEEVIYFNLKIQPSSKKNTDNSDYHTKKKEKYRREAKDRHLVTWIDLYYLNKINEYENNPNIPKPTKRMAFAAYKKELERLKWTAKDVGAIKEKYKRLTTKSKS